jgi:type I restriction enzyme S subunit
MNEVALGGFLRQVKDEVTLRDDVTYQTVGVLSYGKGLFERPPVTGAQTSYKSYFRIRTDQFVYSKLFAWEGAVAVVPPSLDGRFVSQEFPTFDIDAQSALPQYLTLLCGWEPLWARLRQGEAGMGGRRKRVHPTHVESVRVPLPTIQDQRRIVDLIAAFDRCINAAEAVVQQAYAAAAGLVDDIVLATKERLSLGKLAVVTGGKRLPKGTPWAAHPTDHRYIRVTDLREGRIEEGDLVFVPDDVWPQISRYIVKSGDIVVSIVGTIGEVAEVPPSLDGANLTENAARLRVSDTVHPPFLAAFLRSSKGQAEIARLTVGTTQKKLALFRIEQIEVPIPPVKAQIDIAAIYADLATLARTATAERFALTHVRSVLLTTLLHGGHEIPQAYDALLDAS